METTSDGTLVEIQEREMFSRRHIAPSPEEQVQMLATIGVSTIDELIDKTIPADIRLERPLDLPDPLREHDLLARLKEIGALNKQYRSYIGMGYYNTLTPTPILRNLVENPGWYTQYTPYQAEIAQGRLESLLNFQTMVIDLTGMELANASLLDEATAAAEAMHLLHAVRTKDQNDSHKLFVSDSVFPQTLELLQTRATPLGIELVVENFNTVQLDASFFGAVIQYPDGDGAINSYASFMESAHAHGVRVAVASDLLALTLLTPPGEWGADVVFGSSQRLGVPLGYGGPHAAFFASKEEYKRFMPGRIIGVSIDAQGGVAYRMALQTREQHIKRDKATSNICTAQALLANVAAMYAVYHGPDGLREIARKIHTYTWQLASSLEQIGYTVRHSAYFDTIRVDLGEISQEFVRRTALRAHINLRYFDDHSVGISIDETTTAKDVAALVSVFAHSKAIEHAQPVTQVGSALPDSMLRTSRYMTHPVFNTYHSEHEILRYLKSLENKDLSLAHSMIALGSCTMKLNATTEMIPVTWPEFNSLHPFVPRDQADGYSVIFEDLENWLGEVTGFDGVSLQPNAGAQGEYTGLLVIKAYHEHHGNAHRNVTLIPSSAHGTNPASAVMAGSQVVVVKCDDQGNVDVADLRAKAEQYKDRLMALMVTYPSTHGVFEVNIREICRIIHDNGGLVYMDGANMNAQVGLTSPAAIGADVCHLNLHKTFCIPHGGGGPGMGPIGVTAKLVPFLPKHSVIPMENGLNDRTGISAVSAAPWGSASILLISWAYIAMMGSKGLTDATKVAILNANYIKARLEEHFPALYVGASGTVAHEMIIDTRKFKQSAGIEVEDIAKRLMDYGFHAPTVSFPVPGTMMIEPTESEPMTEIDRFCDAMIAIRKEIAEIEAGTQPRENNVLKNAPHTVHVVTADTWDRPYSRTKAAFPVPSVRANKFWPTVGRVNNTHGDRTLICSCPPLESYEEQVAETA